MANKEQVDLIKKGVSYWNNWRKNNMHIWPDLVDADLRDLNLRGINFYTADLREADLSGCELSYADFAGSILIRTDLRNSNLQNANFYIANLNGTQLRGANMSYSIMGVTILVDNDLSEVIGLNDVQHLDRSHMGTDTLQKSNGKIPSSLLVNCGISAEMQDYLSIFQQKSINYYSCFISYSSLDEQFVRKLHTYLDHNKIDCWFAPEDMKIGDKIRSSIDSAINIHDKVILIISENSINSQWVEQEVEKALERERRENRIVLFPLAIDEKVFSIDVGWASYLRNNRNIAFFSNWHSNDHFTKAANRVIKDLKF
ncbi:toll/interleukin-1 receptor domain-containing protein [Salmonirosea aquatica]|uniref:TIR domain-containing protein n=1 Tax=Salmonirosea aquatica TaxID=2654236 RepID=A0A7C9BDZ0_9BACT|nr:TIR domain-containing protein [Cytophagaceae bacterium SJW1-29]